MIMFLHKKGKGNGTSDASSAGSIDVCSTGVCSDLSSSGVSDSRRGGGGSSLDLTIGLLLDKGVGKCKGSEKSNESELHNDCR